MRKVRVHFLIAISIPVILVGCSSLNSLSDKELVKIAKSYYSYYYSENSIDLTVTERGKYEKKCDCYPVKFLMVRAKEAPKNKTLYFYKSDSGTFEAREFKKGIKFVSN
jgi:hypothetical protein